MSKTNKIFQDQSKSEKGFTQTNEATSRKSLANHDSIIVSCVDLLKEMGDKMITKKSEFIKKADKSEKA